MSKITKQNSQRLPILILLLAGIVLLPDLLNAQFSPAKQQGAKLTGTGTSGSANVGYSVAVSSDGNTAILGGYSDNGGVGAAWVYTRSAGVWTQQGSKLVGTGAIGSAYQGTSVAISSDGNTAIVGGFFDNSNAGAAWVYTRSAGIWTQQGTKLVGTGAAGSARQGYSVSISSDGNTAVVGGYADNTGTGAVWVYTRSGGVWTQSGNKLVGTGATSNSFQGSSVAISSNDTTIIAGGYSDNGGTGAVWIYTLNGGIWTQQGNKLIGTGADGSAYQGTSVSISSDGNTAIVGGYNDSAGVGAAWVYIRSAGVWTQQGVKLTGKRSAGSANQGQAVSISGDGNTAILGGDNDSTGTGAIWVYTRTAGVWKQQGVKLVGTGATGAASQGYALAISSDGGTIISGGYNDNVGAGAAWVFVSCISPSAPILSTTFSTNCGVINTRLSVASGALNSAGNWYWYTGSCGGTRVDSGTTIAVKPADTTTYYARAEGGCITSGLCGSITVNVNALPPQPAITPGGPTTFCQGGTVTLTSGSGTSYLWSTGATTAAITVAVSGRDSVTITGSNGCSSVSSAATVITVNPTDNPAFNYSSSTVCQSGVDPTPTITGLAGGNFSSSPAGLSLNVVTGQITLSSSTLATYSVTYTTSGVCPQSSTLNMTITNAPDATFTFANSYCQSGTNPLPTFGAGASAGVFSAAPSGLVFINANTGQIDLTASTPNTYSITNSIAAGGGCSLVSANFGITINPMPIASITPGGPTTFCQGGNVTLTSGTGSSYLWSTGETSAAITVSVSGRDSVIITDSNGCSSLSSAATIVTVDICTGIPAQISKNEVSVYPNPSGGNFVVETSSVDKQLLQVFDLTGKLMLSQFLLTGKSTISADYLPDGIYYVCVTGSGGRTNKRLVIVR